MKTHIFQTGLAVLLTIGAAQAQDVTAPMQLTKKPKGYESVTTYRMGKQSVSLGNLNQALQQTGYPTLPGQFTVFGAQSEMTKSGKRWSVVSQFDFALGPANQLSTTNGTNTARAFFFQYGLGGGYRLINTDKFVLMPKLMFSPAFFRLSVDRNGTTQPSLATVLTNPGSQQSARLSSMTITGDLGLSGQYRFAYKATTKQTDCGMQTQERSLVVGFYAGYRLGPNTGFNRSNNTVADGSPTVNLSGWYATVRLGLGRRYTMVQ